MAVDRNTDEFYSPQEEQPFLYPLTLVKDEYSLDIVTERNQCPFLEYNPSKCVSSMDLPSWITWVRTCDTCMNTAHNAYKLLMHQSMCIGFSCTNV